MYKYMLHFSENDLEDMIQISKISKYITMKGKKLFAMLPGGITRSQGMKLNKRKCRLYIYKVFPIVISIKLWNGLTTKEVEKPSCKSFHTRVDKVFKDTPVEGSLPSCCNGEYNE
jgi:hypothetical protein